MSSRSTCLAAVFLVALTCTGRAAEEPVSSANLAAWLESEWRAPALTIEDLEGVVVRWSDEDCYSPPAAELARMRREISGRPDHPDRDALRRYERIARGDRYAYDYRFYVAGPRDWRLCGDDPDVQYFDTVVSRGGSWQLCAAEMAITSTSDDVSVPGYGVESRLAGGLRDLEFVLTAGVARAGRLGLPVPTITSVNGDRWSARTAGTYTYQDPAYNTPASMTIHGRWDAALGRGFIDRIETRFRSPGQPERTSTVLASGWVWVPELSRFAASRIESVTPPNLRRVYTWSGCRAMEPGEFERVARTPEVDGEDAVRGRVNFAGFWDFRGRDDRYVARRPDGSWQAMTVNTPAGPRTQLATLRSAGWSAAVLTVIAVVALRVRRSM